VVLAAGRATRFGATKQVAELGGVPLVARAVRVATAAARVDAVHVVVGHEADTVAAAARTAGPVEVVVNPRHAEGQATSLRAGIVSAAGAGAQVAVVLLADEPDVAADAVDLVVAAVLDGADAARARYDDGPGHPVAFAATSFDRLLVVEGDQGARGVLADLGVCEVEVGGPRPVDVDTPEDLATRRRR
jgi:molybdenum cofactor cytidylyltransferase